MGSRKFLVKRLVLIVLLCHGAVSVWGCGYVAAGAVGAAVGHEVAEEKADEEE